MWESRCLCCCWEEKISRSLEGRRLCKRCGETISASSNVVIRTSESFPCLKSAFKGYVRRTAMDMCMKG